MATSINTNYGAAVALQNLNATNAMLERTQNRVSTGLKVGSAKDNGAVWAIANTQKANAKALDATINNLLRNQSIYDVGIAAGESIMAALTEAKALAAAIEAGGGSAYTTDFNALMTEITASAAGAVFDGVNALGTAVANPTATAAAVQTAIDGWAAKLQTIGTNAKSAERQLAFNQKLQDALEAGAGNLVDADLAKESAKLTALQTKQQSCGEGACGDAGADCPLSLQPVHQDQR